MTEEEKIAAEALAAKEAAELAAKTANEANQGGQEHTLDPLLEKDAEIARLTEERDNYKAVALKRKGKLAEDDEFFAKEGLEDFIKDKVIETLADKEVARAQAEKEAELKRIIKENSELRLALKNKPETSSGGDSGSNIEVKDSVFTNEQLVALRKRAEILKADPEKFIQNAKSTFLKHR